MWMISLPSTKAFLHTSSGAALGDAAFDKLADPYGYLKHLEETCYPRACEDYRKQYLGLRVWSTTGRYIKTGGLFAIESLISQATSSGRMNISSSGEVWRSYADANEILLAGLIAVFSGATGIYNSGGTKTEIGELAEVIASIVPNVKPTIKRIVDSTATPSVYTSDESSIEEILESHNLHYSDLRTQVINTMEYLYWFNGKLDTRS